MHHVRRALFLVICLGLFLTACGGSSGTGTAPATTPTTAAATTTLNVFAAASLTESFKEIATQYQSAHPNVKLTYNFNGSQILEQQIANGAPSDVFASADQTNMQKATDAGLVDTPQVFVKNRLVVIVPSGGSAVKDLKDLANKGVKIDIAGPTVPAGKYALQVLDKMGKSSAYGPSYVSGVKSNFVSQEDNVKAVVQKVQLGEADAGFVYRTDVTDAVSSKVMVIDIPDDLNVIAEYPIAVTKASKSTTEAQAFVQYILSPEGQAVMVKYHFSAGK